MDIVGIVQKRNYPIFFGMGGKNPGPFLFLSKKLAREYAGSRSARAFNV
jgi:hypothetical protein